MSDFKMPDLNMITLAGRLTRDPELRYLEGGTKSALCKFSLAVTRKYKSKGEPREDTVFIDVTCWRGTAEYVGEHMRKGMAVIVFGHIKQDNWDDKATGQKRSKLFVDADRVQGLTWDDSGEKPGPAREPQGELPDGVPF